jgi:hypothetical protein
MAAEPLSVLDAFPVRHSTRNFSSDPLMPERRTLVQAIVSEANSLPRFFGGQVEVVLAPHGFGFMNFIVHEQGWLLAKQPTTTDPAQKRINFIDTGVRLETCIIRLTQNHIATCWISGTYKRSKAVAFCGGGCEVPGVVAFGGDAADRWLDRTVKWFGSFRGKNSYRDKFFDRVASAPITEDAAGERAGICAAIASIPCAIKPHAFRIVFDEPNIHIYTMPGPGGAYAGGEYFDIGNVIAHVKLFYEAHGRGVQIVPDGLRPAAGPEGAEYICTAILQ